MINSRYQNFPQLELYDKMAGTRYLPFAILVGPKNYQSQDINTDSKGFRFTKYRDSYISTQTVNVEDEINIVIGSSTAFGIGSSNDNFTLSSYLHSKTKKQWLNLGVRGCVSIHEVFHLIQLMPKFKKINNVIIFSGVNDIYINFLKDEILELDPRFDETISNRMHYVPSRLLTCEFLAKVYGCEVSTLLPLSKREIFLYPFIHKKFAKVVKPKATSIDKMNNLKEIYLRNFQLYSALQKQFSCNFVFCLQPFFPWSNKKATLEEQQVFDHLEKVQKYSKFLEIKEIIGNDSIFKQYNEILRSHADNAQIRYINLNENFTNNETLFCDQVHLVDKGYEAVSQKIVNFLK